MREFYVYGFKSREEYDKKSARSYDDERRRMESWLGDHMSFVRTHEGKNVFISIDSRVLQHNPFYKALKAKSFTDGDITLHFILFDILHSPEIVLSLPEILDEMDEYLSGFENTMMFDESTVRKKLKEYTEQGIIISKKDGRKMMYRRADDIVLPDITDVLNFYSEVAPCGVIGSFLLDKQDTKRDSFNFKHHYITSFNEVADTNLEAVFNLILDVVVKNNVPQSELPSKLIIISDMEFNSCVRDSGTTNFKNAKVKFEDAGYKISEVVFWNVASRNRQQPVSKKEQGVLLVSGYIPKIFSMVADGILSDSILYEFMIEVLMSERYEKIAV